MANLSPFFSQKNPLKDSHFLIFFVIFFGNPGSTWTMLTIFNVNPRNLIPQKEQERQGKQSGEKEKARGGAQGFQLCKPSSLVRAHIEIIITHDLWLQVGQMCGMDR